MSNKLYTKGSAPLDIEATDVYSIILARASLVNGGFFAMSSGTLSGTSTVTGSIIPTMTLSNTVTGKKLAVSLSGANIGAGPNTVTVNGTTFGGPVTEIFTFSIGETQISTEYWLTISSIAISVTATISTLPAAALQISEAYPLNRAENAGTYADLQYDNGVFSFFQAGTSSEFPLSRGIYFIDYPTPISIALTNKGNLNIGADLNGENFAQCVLEAPQFFNAALVDVRTGETAPILSHTSLHNLPLHPVADETTTLLLDLDNQIKMMQDDYIAFDGTHQTDIYSVNSEFGASVVVDRPLKFSNATEILGPKTGTIEFFMSPMHDTWESSGLDRQIFDITNLNELAITSTTSAQIILPFRVRSIEKIYLFGDIEKKNIAGFQLGADLQTIKLSNRLSKQRTECVVQYTPSSSSGDRMELRIDGYTMLNFMVQAGGRSMQVARPINWKRNTWHRIMCTWDIGNTAHNDRIRLFVDGVEDNVVTWGTGAVWGDGTIWGQGMAANTEAVLGDLPAFEVFGQAVFGSDFSGANPYPFRLDNLRFSSAARSPVRIGARDYDLAWNDNIDSMSPVIEDAVTKSLYDFNTVDRLTTSFANLLGRDTPLYSIGVQIDDGFSKLADPRVRAALLNIYQRTKPAHMRLYTSIKQEQ